jgi:Uma2 family endonuclease
MATASPPMLISPADNGRAMTLDEFMDAEFQEGYRYELARGVIEVSNIPSHPHAEIIWRILSAIAIFQREHPKLIRYAGAASEFRLLLPGFESERHPDVSVVLAGTARDHTGHYPPALSMEVVSKGAKARRRDYQEKREEYLAFGLREYWIVDPSERRVTVLTRRGDIWSEQIFGDGREAIGLVLPGFTVPVAELWADYDHSGDDADEMEVPSP